MRIDASNALRQMLHKTGAVKNCYLLAVGQVWFPRDHRTRMM